jgi:hypothetical protein
MVADSRAVTRFMPPIGHVSTRAQQYSKGWDTNPRHGVSERSAATPESPGGEKPVLSKAEGSAVPVNLRKYRAALRGHRTARPCLKATTSGLSGGADQAQRTGAQHGLDGARTFSMAPTPKKTPLQPFCITPL